MKNFLGYIFSFLLGIVLIIPWVYKVIIKFRSGEEYVAGGLPGISGLFYEMAAGIGLMFIGGTLWSIYDNLMKYKSIAITLHYTKIGLRIISVLVGVAFLIGGILFISEDFDGSVPLIFVSVPLIVIGCKLSFKIMLYLFAILIVLLPFFNSSFPNDFFVFNFVFAAVLIWFAESLKREQDKLVEKAKGDEVKKDKKKKGEPTSSPFS